MSWSIIVRRNLIVVAAGFGLCMSGCGSSEDTRVQSAAYARLDPLDNQKNLFRSLDGGNTWSNLDTSEFDEGLGAIAIDPQSPNVLYASEFFLSGMFKSTDGGKSWTKTPTSMPRIQEITVDPHNSTTLYAASYGACSLGCTGSLLKSTDSGVSFTPLDSLPLRYEGRVLSVSVDPGSSNVVVAGTSDGVYRSVDAGAHWTRLSLGVNENYVRFVVMDPAKSTTLYAATVGDFDQVHNRWPTYLYKSVDAGARWSHADAGLSNLNFWALAVDPANSALVYAATDDGLFRSSDGASTWVRAALDGGPVYTVTVAAGDASVVYAGLDSGVFKSLDQGKSWSASSVGIPGGAVVSIVLPPAQP